jgi:uncharacterized protein (DUF433 family)
MTRVSERAGAILLKWYSCNILQHGLNPGDAALSAEPIDRQHLSKGPIVDEQLLLARITVNPNIFGGKPIVRGRRLAVEHVLGMLAAGDTPDILLEGYPWLEKEDIQACLVYARRIIGHERIEPLKIESAA